MRPGGKLPGHLKSYRLSRLFRPPARRCVGISFVPGRTECAAGRELGLPDRILELALTGIEALHLPLGLAAHLQSLDLPVRPALIVQADVTNVTGGTLPPTPFCRTIDNLTEHAVRADAAGISARLFEIPEAPALAAQCRRNIQRLKTACDRFCIPMLIDCRTSGTAQIQRALDAGADLIAVDNPSDFAALTSSGKRIPFLVRIDAATPDARQNAERAYSAGASGVLLTTADSPTDSLTETARAIHALSRGNAFLTP